MTENKEPKVWSSVAQTFLSVIFGVVFKDYTGKNACATKEDLCTYFWTNPKYPLHPEIYVSLSECCIRGHTI